jgi:hypothetical protein
MEFDYFYDKTCVYCTYFYHFTHERMNMILDKILDKYRKYKMLLFF